MFDRVSLKNKAKLIYSNNSKEMIIFSIIFTIYPALDSFLRIHSYLWSKSRMNAFLYFLKLSFKNTPIREISGLDILVHESIVISSLTLIAIFVLTFINMAWFRYILNKIDNSNRQIKSIKVGSSRYFHIVWIIILKEIKIGLWSLLLIIPGIIKAYEYYMIPYIIADNPDISTSEAFSLSKQLTTNNKMNIFVLNLSFIGWRLLGFITIIGHLFVLPYVVITNVCLYNELLNKALITGEYDYNINSSSTDFIK